MGLPLSLDDYYARVNSRLTDKDAQVVGKALDEVIETGPLTAERIVDAARPETAPLHPFFEWNDEKAAELYRRGRACHLARSVEIVKVLGTGEKLRVPRFVHVELSREEREEVGLEPAGESPYILFERVLGEREKLEQKKEQALQQLRHWREVHSLWVACSAEFQETFQPVLDAISQIEEIRQEVVT